MSGHWGEEKRNYETTPSHKIIHKNTFTPFFKLLPARMESQSVPRHAWNRINKHGNF